MTTLTQPLPAPGAPASHPAPDGADGLFPFPLPRVIQGGMGVGVSSWKLARAVSRAGQLGVVSGTALNSVLIRRLQDGDPSGLVRSALAACPLAGEARAICDRYYLPGGRGDRRPYALSPMFTLDPPRDLVTLTIVAAFVEVRLAREGHRGPVGINLLEKIQLPILPTLFGAMLAGVDAVLMGAGIPRAIPGVLDRLAAGQPVRYRIDVAGAPRDAEHHARLDPADFFPHARPVLRRPAFIAIVSSSALATSLARKADGRVDGFIVEGPAAGGHNAPPRGGGALSADSEPVYGPRDEVDLAAIRALGRPFWLAGSCGTPGRLEAARAAGAAGVQVGTAFAFCEESGLDPALKARVLAEARAGTLRVRTDPRASPTGMPFKVVQLAGTVSDPAVARTRLCDLGYLREACLQPDGSIAYRCPGAPADGFVRKGGRPEDTAGRQCLCNGLMAGIGLAQRTASGGSEPPILTAGDCARDLGRYLAPEKTDYTAADVLRHLGV